jgi:hypothetical protein
MGRGSVPSLLPEKLRAAGERVRNAALYLGDDVSDGLQAARTRADVLAQDVRDEVAWWRDAIRDRRAGRLPTSAPPPGRRSARIVSLTTLLLAVVLIGGALAELPGGDVPGEPGASQASGQAATTPGGSPDAGKQIVKRNAGAIAEALAAKRRGEGQLAPAPGPPRAGSGRDAETRRHGSRHRRGSGLSTAAPFGSPGDDRVRRPSPKRHSPKRGPSESPRSPSKSPGSPGRPPRAKEPVGQAPAPPPLQHPQPQAGGGSPPPPPSAQPAPPPAADPPHDRGRGRGRDWTDSDDDRDDDDSGDDRDDDSDDSDSGSDGD